ncbi:MAG: energy transducer TonB [Bacteroidetes bacterium]|nr:energy transducer TonB [Bacteroidota bacterium]
MTNKTEHISLHDIAFEGRNQAYGAYVLRKNANRRIGYSLLIALGIFLLLIILFYAGMKWVHNHQPIYEMPSISVGVNNAIPSIFSSGLESIRSDKKKEDNKTIKKTSPDFKEVSETAPAETDELVSKNSEATTGSTTGGNAAHSGQGIPWGSGEVFLAADVIPQFEGGRDGLAKYLSKNVRYPEPAIDKHLQGTVLVCFVITSDGEVKDVKIVKGIDPLLDNEAMRVISGMPLWKPGLRAGKPVNIVLTLPIRFDLKLHFSG